MLDQRIALLDALLEGADNIPGASIDLPDDGKVWLHTTAAVESWLHEEREILVKQLNALGGPTVPDPSADRPLLLVEKIKSFTEEDVELVVDAMAEAHCYCPPGPRCSSHYTEAEAALTALATTGRLLPVDAEHREEWAVHWLGERGGIAMVDAQLASRRQAEELGPQRVGMYNITGYSLHRRVHQRFADGSTLIGPWVEVDENTTEEAPNV